MPQTFMFLSQIVTWNIALIPKIMTWLLQLGMTYTSQKMSTSQCPWHKQNSMTWLETRFFQRNLLSHCVHVSMRNIGCHKKQLFYWCWDCERELRQFFTFHYKSSLVYCNNIAGLIKSMRLKYDTTKWRLLVDSSSKSLKAILLHNGNSFLFIPIGHSVQMKEIHNSNGSFAVCSLTTWSTNGWSVEIWRWLDWS